MSKMTVQDHNALQVKARLSDGQSYTMRWTWRTSRGRDTYGENICTCFMGSYRVGRAMGGNYDMKGASMGQFINAAFSEELKALDSSKLYGLINKGDRPYVDGAAGYNNMVSILEALGFNVEYLYLGKNDSAYLISKC